MRAWLHKIELVVDKIIPYLLIPLLFLLAGDLFYSDALQPYEIWISLIDSLIVSVFLVDLIFKYIRIKNIPTFFRKCWLDIIAVFPFFLVFRIFEELGLFARFWEQITEAQPIFRESLEIETEANKIITEAEKVTKASRTSNLARIIRPLLRSPRLLRIAAYYERPTGKHHPHEKYI